MATVITTNTRTNRLSTGIEIAASTNPDARPGMHGNIQHIWGQDMTPFGERIRALRADRAVTLKDMADALQVSAAYLSALEHGRITSYNVCYTKLLRDRR